MLVAMAVFLFGCGLTALGIVESAMYDIGICVMFIGVVGLAVRTIEWIRWLRE